NLGRLTAATDPAKIKEADVIIICVPTPLTPNKDPDLTYIKEAVKQVEKHLRPGHLITLESTTYPGTTEEIVLPNLAKTGLKVGEDYFLAFSPERVDPGNSNFNTKNTTKIVGGVTKQCTRVASTFYRQTIENVVEVSSPAIAEMAKIFENTYRAVNIALVNEFMLLCSKMKIDIWEVLDAAATKPFGIQVFYPGPGIGGHCIPIDPYYLAWKAKEYDFSLRFVDLAGQINNEAIWYVISLLNSILNEKKKSLRGANLLLVGVAYKRDVDDYRESPSLKIISILRENGANVSYHDPFIPEIYLSAKGTYLQSVELTKENLAKADCTLIITDHSNLDYQFIVDNAQVVLDTRNATKNVQKGREKIIRV
ncbi:MAG TPA: nucleotide sugar dehydrogenase, partial [Clostridia bacterium]|nr:nucleotide sugar dehydrogenase [Clostridia bacterium]